MKNESLRQLWSDRITEWKSSGLTASAWSIQNDLNVHTLKYWIQKFNKEKLSVPKTNWVTLESPKEKDKCSTSPVYIKIHIGKALIEVPTAVSSETLRCIFESLDR
ncbi:IS66 family insertion sequence element accessory protein TnpA [Fusibacter ferrireducens]|uniref:Transposase n=1 Tax=Fusibacter ferrireducens TaxID=2785058 RepID=A0ABS0A1L5_9FIRM|nr:hypothetical protein [Fusibacter ferrireducens]MBF4696106.1 hypothetical protein [Fusibacter ferrireducens]